MDLEKFWENIEKAESIGITGHVNPDGDCIGSCLAMYNYILNKYNKKAELFLETIPAKFRFINGGEDVITDYPDRNTFDVFIAIDSGDLDRIGIAEKYLNAAKHSYCFDHHGTNTGYAQENLIDPGAAAAAELLALLFDEEYIDLNTAKALYLGIVHDTGVFKHSNTTRKTMETAGMLLEKGVISSEIIDKTFYEKTYIQNQVLGRCLMESILLMDGKVIVSYVSAEVQKLYGISTTDMSGIIDQLRITKGVEVAILLKESKKREWFVSMRSNEIVDVSRISVMFGGGGHIRAAGCTMYGSAHDCINSLTKEIEKQLI
ncbi:MAG: bifunctional oligoribonuclease/PAP phosphatase NrnA [Lachnospiraceae bacterium]|nr:bifunctional oligoribonuclease/PAP phosphatase NrnA [Lachnospiraceae bacterium]